MADRVLRTVSIYIDQYTPQRVIYLLDELEHYAARDKMKVVHGLPSPKPEPIGPEHRLVTYEELLNFMRPRYAHMEASRFRVQVSSIWSALVRARDQAPLVAVCQNCRVQMERCRCPMGRPGGSMNPAFGLSSLRDTLEFCKTTKVDRISLSRIRLLEAWVGSIKD